MLKRNQHFMPLGSKIREFLSGPYLLEPSITGVLVPWKKSSAKCLDHSLGHSSPTSGCKNFSDFLHKPVLRSIKLKPLLSMVDSGLNFECLWLYTEVCCFSYLFHVVVEIFEDTSDELKETGHSIPYLLNDSPHPCICGSCIWRRR